MQVVLLERIENLGGMGDVVNVKPGYARNFLLPQKKALRATEANIERFERERAGLEKLNAERKAEAEKHGKSLDGQGFVLIRQAGDTGQLYGSVTSRDIAQAAGEAGHSVARSAVRLDQPIKSIGLYDVRIGLHPEVYVTVKVNVARSADEADRQAKGENVLATLRDADRAEQDAARAEAEAARAALFEEGAAPALGADQVEGGTVEAEAQ